MNILLDIEANGFNPTQIFCIVCLDVDTGEVKTFDVENIEEGVQFIQSSTKLIGHNIIGYDIPAIERIYNIDLSHLKIVDTLVLSRLFNPTREGGHGLENWGHKLNFAKGKYGDKENAWDFYTKEMLEYCIQDVILNKKVYDYLKIESKGFSPSSVKLEHQVAKIINTQRQDGFMLDEEKASKLLAHLKEKLIAVEKEVHKTFKPKVNNIRLTPRYTKTGMIAKTASSSEDKNFRLTDYEYKVMLRNKVVTRQIVTPFNLGSRKQIGEYLIDFGWRPKKLSLIHI